MPRTVDSSITGVALKSLAQAFRVARLATTRSDGEVTCKPRLPRIFTFLCVTSCPSGHAPAALHLCIAAILQPHLNQTGMGVMDACRILTAAAPGHYPAKSGCSSLMDSGAAQ